MNRPPFKQDEQAPCAKCALALLIALLVMALFARCKAPDQVYYPPGWRPWPTLNTDYKPQKANEMENKGLIGKTAIDALCDEIDELKARLAQYEPTDPEIVMLHIPFKRSWSKDDGTGKRSGHMVMAVEWADVSDDDGTEVGSVRLGLGCQVQLTAKDNRDLTIHVGAREIWNAYCKAVGMDHYIDEKQETDEPGN